MDELFESLEMGENEAEERFTIKTDSEADWAIRKIKEERQEYERIKALAKEQILDITNALENAEKRVNHRTAYLEGLLNMYFESLPEESKKATKTQSSYALLSGKLVKKHVAPKFNYVDDVLVGYLLNSGNDELVDTVLKPRWGDFKKLCEVVDGRLINKATGEVIECVHVEAMPDKFTVSI